MTDILDPLPTMPDLEPAFNRKRWTRSECEFLERKGLLTGRYELVNGDINPKMGL